MAMGGRTRRCLHLTSLVKFGLFMLFTIAYCYFAYVTLPSTRPTRPTITFYGNYSKKRNFKLKEELAYNWSAVEKELSERRDTVHEACINSPGPKLQPNAWEFVIDAHHSLIWCNVFKAASSAWMYNFNLLGGYAESFLRISHKNPITLMRARFPRPSIRQLQSSLPTSLSFLIVRDPFHRLLSAYRNKMERLHSHYYRRLAKTIIIRYRSKPPKEESIGPSFEEFVKYITESHGRVDEHWAPIYKFCTPCAVNFTVIAKLETLSRDQQYVIHHAGLGKILTAQRMKYQNAARSSLQTKDLVHRYYSKLNRELIHKLVTMYTMDFDMFGYNATQYYDMVNM